MRYCSRECQRAHWRLSHKMDCPLLREAVSSGLTARLEAVTGSPWTLDAAGFDGLREGAVLFLETRAKAAVLEQLQLHDVAGAGANFLVVNPYAGATRLHGELLGAAHELPLALREQRRLAEEVLPGLRQRVEASGRRWAGREVRNLRDMRPGDVLAIPVDVGQVRELLQQVPHLPRPSSKPGRLWLVSARRCGSHTDTLHLATDDGDSIKRAVLAVLFRDGGCPVCMEAYQPGSRLITLSCGHIYNLKCGFKLLLFDCVLLRAYNFFVCS